MEINQTNVFEKYEGYVGESEKFNGVIFCLREANSKKSICEFWFKEIVLQPQTYYEQLEKEDEKSIRRNKQIATKFKNRFSEILKRLGKENDLSNVIFCNVNAAGGKSKVGAEYKQALLQAPEKLKNIILSVKGNDVVLCTCMDIYEKLKFDWEGEERASGGITYTNGKSLPWFQCEIGTKKVTVYGILHPSRSPKVKIKSNN